MKFKITVFFFTFNLKIAFKFYLLGFGIFYNFLKYNFNKYFFLLFNPFLILTVFGKNIGNLVSPFSQVTKKKQTNTLGRSFKKKISTQIKKKTLQIICVTFYIFKN